MEEIYPSYYKKFKCISDKCKHNCCVGWEIDIDEDTVEYYSSLNGELADRIRKNIEGDPPHFVLDERERCPFLNKNGLCDIICELGESAICDICRLHPRFCNFYDDFTEIGLGLSCEEAARIILTEEEKFTVDLPEFVKDSDFFKTRAEAFDIMQNRSLTVLKRFTKLAEKYGARFDYPTEELYRLYSSLERLDVAWDAEIEKLKGKCDTGIFEREDLQIFFEQLACYFIFRHFDGGVGFALVSSFVIGMMCSKCENIDEMLDVVRMYSSEIEYSQENTEKVKAFCFR